MSTVDARERELTTLAWRVAWTARLNAIASVAIGLMMVFWPRETLLVAAVMLGLFLVLQGATRLVEAFAARSATGPQRGLRAAAGVLLVVAGIVVIRQPGSSLTVVAVLGAVALLIGGAVELVTALSVRQQGWLVRGVLGLVGLVAGVVVLAWPRPGLHAFAVVAGISLVAIGVAQFLVVRNAAGNLRSLGVPPF